MKRVMTIACLGTSGLVGGREEKVRRTGVSEKGVWRLDLQESGFLAEKSHD